jgi:hypothetical protein
LTESAQLALEDEQFKHMIPMSTAAAIPPDHEDGIDNPMSYQAPIESPPTDEWDTVIKQDLDALRQPEIYGNFVELPAGRKAWPSQWVYQIMYNGACDAQRIKAKLICGVNHQNQGIYYKATYALCACLGHITPAPSIATKYDLQIHQMDVCTVFLDVDLEEEKYMHPPLGYICLLQNGSRFNDPRSTQTSQKIVLCFQLFLCGLKQSLYISYGMFEEIVITIGCAASRVDGGRYVLLNDGIIVAAVVLDLDEPLLISNESLNGKINDQMKMRFWMHAVGRDSFHFGMDMQHNQEHPLINMLQRSYI